MEFKPLIVEKKKKVPEIKQKEIFLKCMGTRSETGCGAIWRASQLISQLDSEVLHCPRCRGYLFSVVNLNNYQDKEVLRWI